MRALLAVRDARIYLLGQTVSLFGDSVLWLAMGIWVKTLTGSNSAAGLVFFCFTAPSLLSPISGLLVDRVRRRLLLIVTNVAIGLAVLLLLLVDGAGRIWLIYLVMAFYGLCYSVLSSAQSALLTVMLPAELLADANAALRTVQESLRLIGPLLGAGLFVLVGGHILAVIDAATFVVPILTLSLLRLREPAPQPRLNRWRQELTAGLRHVARTPALRQVVIATACGFGAFGLAETVIYAVVGTGLHRPPGFVGVLISVQGVGAVIGGPTAAPLVRRIGEARLVSIALLLAAVGALLAAPPLLPSVLAGLVLIGISLPWLVVGFVTLIQRLTPAELQGRAYSAADTLVSTPQTLAIALGAALISLTGYRALIGVMAASSALSAIYLLTRPVAPLVRTGEPRADTYSVRL